MPRSPWQPAAVKLEGRKIGRGAQDVEPGDLGSAEPTSLTWGKGIKVLNLELQSEMEDPSSHGDGYENNNGWGFVVELLPSMS